MVITLVRKVETTNNKTKVNPLPINNLPQVFLGKRKNLKISGREIMSNPYRKPARKKPTEP